MIGVVGLLLVVVTITSATTYFLLRPFLLQRLDQQLNSVASGNATSVRQCILSGGSACSVGVPSGGRAAQLATPQREWIVGYDSDGNAVINVTANIASLSQLNLSDRQRMDTMADPAKVRTIATRRPAAAGDRPADPDPARTPSPWSPGCRWRRSTTPCSGCSCWSWPSARRGAAGGGPDQLGRPGRVRPLTRVTRTAQEVTAELSPDGSGLDRRVPGADPSTEVGKVASSVNTLLQAVETEFAARVRSEERMRQFLADASHELRTPLTSIRGYAELARLQGRATDSPR